jgi:hypothetical protein
VDAGPARPVFDTDRAGDELRWAWPAALVALCDAGRVDRGEVLSGCLRRMRAGDRPGALRQILAVYQQLSPGPDDFAAHRQEYVGMLSSPHLSVAGAAQAALLALDDAGRLPVEALMEASRAILLRPEKKLVHAQLTRLDRVARQRPDDLPAVLGAVAVGLGHESVDLAERTLAVVARHLARADEPTRAALRQAASTLAGDLRRQADGLLDLEPAASPPAPQPAAALGAAATPFAPAGSLGELAGEVGRLLRDRNDPVLLERVLDGLIRYVRADPDGVRAALAPLVVAGWADPVSNALRAAAGLPRLTPAPRTYEPAPDPPVQMAHRRLTELAAQLVRVPPAGLLATPATTDGQVDPDRVVSLLEQADRDGWQPGSADLCQSLLRLPREVEPAVHSRAAHLTSPAGRTLHRWLVSGGLPDPVVRKVVTVKPECTHGPGPYYNNYRCWCADLPPSRNTVEVLPPIHEPVDAPARLLDLPGGEAAYQRCYGSPWPPAMGWWPTVLPSHREIIAAHVQPHLTPIGDSDGTGGTQVLPALARSSGPFGPAMALALAYGLGARREKERLPVVDALVWCSLRGELDALMLGRELAELVTADLIVLNRVVRGLTEFARADAHRDLWAMIAAMLPDILVQPTPGPGTPDLLALAATAANATGVYADLPQLAAVAARGGSSRLVSEARRLARTLQHDPTTG